MGASGLGEGWGGVRAIWSLSIEMGCIEGAVS